MELYLTFGIIALGILLFARETFSIDTTSLLILALFIITGVLSPEDGFSGFIHPATLILGCMFVISAAIFKTGIIDGLSHTIIRLAKIHYLMALAVFCFVTALFSAFVNDAAVVALMIPMALLVSKETGINPAKLLLPISFAACFGGACTLVGTGTNILISTYAQESGLAGFGMFEFSRAALVLAGVGMVYVLFIAPFLLPKRNQVHDGQSLVQAAETYIAEIDLEAACPDLGKTISQARLTQTFKAQILHVLRGEEKLTNITSEFTLLENDRLKILISPDKLVHLKDEKGYSIRGDKMAFPLAEEEEVPPEARRIYEVLIPAGSPLAGKSLQELRFRNTYGASVLALRQREETILQHLSEVKLKEGDILLVYVRENHLGPLLADQLVVVLSHYERKRVDYKKAVPALLIGIGVIAAAALELTSLLISGMVGCLLLITTSLLKPEEAYQAIDWKVIFMMAGVLSMGKALETTGGSELISLLLFEHIGGLAPRITLSLIFLVTFLSTNILSSRAAAALMTPIVIGLAGTLGVSERPFLIAVMFACAFTFITPMCNPTNTMVYSPGNYKFMDYVKVGTPLNILIWIVATYVIPRFFPF